MIDLAPADWPYDSPISDSGVLQRGLSRGSREALRRSLPAEAGVRVCGETADGSGRSTTVPSISLEDDPGNAFGVTLEVLEALGRSGSRALDVTRSFVVAIRSSRAICEGPSGTGAPRSRCAKAPNSGPKQVSRCHACSYQGLEHNHLRFGVGRSRVDYGRERRRSRASRASAKGRSSHARWSGSPWWCVVSTSSRRTAVCRTYSRAPCTSVRM